ncbi:bifunctional folylpolyglutamate synthase/dihydrofolate synthase [Bacillus taeanensis]|uniref:bifunctional folylpolyglutamate synthase/dihydrofolate synthase n=1 Tax=Bacillus taeanensis TaxID=273032 RepID=UPI00115928F7|nr:Mur ligase family protein [Bacillus taeanensis]
MNYIESTNYLKQFYSRTTNRTANHHLSIMEELFHLFHLNESQFDIVQVTGSCGKGSTVTYISHILLQNNISHGVFTGPHLLRYEERFAVNGSLISSHDFCEIVTTIAQILKNYPKENEVGHMHVMTLLAFLYFRKLGIKLVIFENGSGGLSDPSNILNPVIAVFTEITFDHTHLLGNSIEEITRNKAAIIKNRTKYVAAGMRNKKARTLLKSLAAAKNASFRFIDEHYKSTYKKQLFHYRGFTEWILPMSFPAEYQQQNFTNAVCVMELLQKIRYPISQYSPFNTGDVLLPGRMEWTEICGEEILLDGAHNEYELASLKREIEKQNLKNPLFFMAFSSNKDIEKMVKSIALKEAFYIIVPSPFHERRINHKVVESVFHSLQLPYTYHENIERGLQDFLRRNNNQSKVITGSLYLIGFIKQKQKEGFINDTYNTETS